MFTSDDFSRIMRQYPYDEKFVVGVSGGADSMALTLLLSEFLTNTLGDNKNMIAVTIDHRLRPESEEEALLVQKWLTQRGVQHEILVWKHGDITSRVEELGRIARYELMTDFCEQHGIGAIYTAHHAMDQVETFLMRLKRGAGLPGLCAIRPIICRNNICIIRPLLGVFAEDLRAILTGHFVQGYLHDPYNDNENYERCNLRNNMQSLGGIGLEARAILATVKHLQSIEQQLQDSAQKIIESRVKRAGSLVLLERRVLQEHIPQVVKLVLSKILECVAEKETLCPQRLLDNLFDKIIRCDFKKTTAKSCVIAKRRGFLEFSKENRPVKGNSV
jgi:tRNA(Ile)-lysidine synthase